ncbi:ribonuclease H-like domain-containing protein [Tanacetum coccineum]|uniref:Ribonuclease H-like domain-containing protein n=1 Tax=Tanacetum coccineum TaxID=301880 RepID=A0ABQ4ZX49_9ASTR
MHQVQPPLLERVNQSPAGPRFRNAWSRSRLVSPLYALHKTEKVLQLLEGLMLSEMRSKTKQRKIKEVIVNGDAPIVASASVEGPIPPKTAEQKLTKKNELKAKSTLPRFGGTIESKKMPIDTSEAGNMRNFLGIKISTLDKTYDRHNEHRDEFVQQFEGVEAAITRPIQAQAQLSEVAFVTSENTSSTNEAVNTAHEVSTTNLEQINTDDLEEIDLKCRWPGLPIRVNRFLKNIGRNLNFNVKETVGFDNTKVECYKCHMRGHFAREYKAPRNQGNRNGDAPRTIIPVETPANALIVQDEIGGYDWSFQAEEGLGGKHCSNGAKHPIRKQSFLTELTRMLMVDFCILQSPEPSKDAVADDLGKNLLMRNDLPTRSLIHDLEDTDLSWIEAMQEELLQFKLQKVWTLVDLPKGKRAIGTKWMYRNKKDVVRNKVRLVAQGYTQEEGIVMIGNLLPDARLKQLDDAQDIPDEFYGGARFLLRVARQQALNLDSQSIAQDEEAEDVDVLTFSNSDYAEASLDMKSTTRGCQFLSKRLISWQYKKQTIVANSTTEAEYVAAANCYGQEDRMERASTTASSLEAEQDSVTEDMGVDSATPTDSHSIPIITQPYILQNHKRKKSRRKQSKDSAPTKPTIEETTPEEHSQSLQMIHLQVGGKNEDLDADAEETYVEKVLEEPVVNVCLHATKSIPLVLTEVDTTVHCQKKDQFALDEEMDRNLKAQLQAELIEEERLVRQKEEEANIALIESWNNTQAMIEADFELAQRLQAEEQGEITIEERSRLFVELMNRRKKHFAKLRAEEIRRNPPTKAQKRNKMSTYLKNMAGYKHSQLKSKSYDEIQKLFDKEMKRLNTFVDMNSEVVKGSETRTEESSKRAVDELESDMSKK